MKQNGTILIVDDESGGRETLEALLTTQGYGLAFASNGPEALAKAAALMPDLILLDVMMPEMDGFEVCQRLRADPLLAEVPVIMITALDGRDSHLRGIEAGADDFISKPFDHIELRARVRTIARINRYRRLLVERAKFEWVVEEAHDGYLMISDNEQVFYANSQARLYLGLPTDRSAPISETFQALARKQYRCEPQAAWAKPTEQRPRYLVRPESPTANAFWLQVDILDLPTGPDGGSIVRLCDVTEKMTLQCDMHGFHEMIFHKLRTPLVGMVGSLELLAQYASELATTEVAAFAGAAFKSVKRLHGEIEDILQYAQTPSLAQLGAGFHLSQLQLLVAKISHDLGLETVSMSSQESLAEARLSLSQRAMELVLWEILENAKKFHPSQTPTIKVCVSWSSLGEVRIQISDDGLVLSPEQLTQMWAPYYQGEKHFTGEATGMGLGLATVASLIWAVGGTCRAYNQNEGPGVVVELALPLEKNNGEMAG